MGRMQLSALPLLFLLVLSVFSKSALTTKKWFPVFFPVFFPGLMILCIVISMNAYPVNAMKQNIEASRHPEAYTPKGTTPANYRYTGKSIDLIRKALELKTVSFLVPDVGGLSLGHEKIRVLDSALLTSTYLAKHGYQAFGRYLKTEKPDIIETHGLWSHVSGIYHLDDFRNNYFPVIVQDHWLYLRRDHVDYLSSKSLLKPWLKADSRPWPRYSLDTIDQEFIASQDFNVKQLIISSY